MKEWDIYCTAIIFMIFTNGLSKFNLEVGKTQSVMIFECFLGVNKHDLLNIVPQITLKNLLNF